MAALFAIVRHGGRQYRVRDQRYILVDKMSADVGEEIAMRDVLMLGSDDDKAMLRVGEDVGKDTYVSARVIEQRRLPKIIVFKKKRRQNYRRKKGFRAEMTLLKIESILPDGKGGKISHPLSAKPSSDIKKEYTHAQSSQRQGGVGQAMKEEDTQHGA
ncbi:MAG: 50S ribosomal protein L21 [Alphaproteobacteria bacterium GM7ARS4]|nr:50S ribosomal protein L21 [Alphaproteobacteria bacterium GM7ARS4]